MSGGFGAGPWGGGPWGGTATSVSSSLSAFDIFCYTGNEAYNLDLQPGVSLVGNGAQFIKVGADSAFEICGGGASYPTTNARAIISATVPQDFTVEWTVNFDSLPNDFSDVVHSHIYLSATDAAGPLVGLFFSKIGVAYTGSVSFDGSDNLQLDTTFQQIPGSNAYVSEGEYWVIRAAASTTVGVVYLYVTKKSEVDITGHQLRAILPVIPYTAAVNPPVDQVMMSVRGTAAVESCVSIESVCLGTNLIIPNLAPVANAGNDAAVRFCEVVQLNGEASFDPEGSKLAYYWRLITAPTTSQFTIEKHDGRTYPLAVPTGFTDKFHSTQLALVDGLDPISVGVTGDVLFVQGIAYTLVGKGTDVNGFYVQIGNQILPDNLSVQTFQVLRQRGISGVTSSKPTFLPDVAGFYRFDLTVNDGALLSDPSVVIINVLESPLPRACVPDLKFLFSYLSDFWNLVEDRDKISSFWSSLAQVTATELFTLWQIEYSKSLRDIQRTFNRRWLHYDTLLAEPIPELTKIHAIFGGYTTGAIPVGGINGFSGLTFTVTSGSLAAPVVITLTAPDPVTAQEFKDIVDRYLSDKGFTTYLFSNRSTTDQYVRIVAPFPFIISIGGSEVGRNSLPSGTTGFGVGSSSYKVEISLYGYDIKEDDFLVLDGIAYRIARVVDDPSDVFPFQRLVLKDLVPTNPSSSWKISGWVSSELLDFYQGLVYRDDHVDFEVSEIGDENASTKARRDIVEVRALGVSEASPDHLALDFWSIGDEIYSSSLQVFLARVVRRHYVPVDKLVLDVPTLQQKIVVEDDQATLRRNVDYFIEDVRGLKGLRFVSGLDAGPDVWEGVRPPDRLWAEYTYLDNNPTIEGNFGIGVDFTLEKLADLPENVDYLSAVRGLYYAFYNGPTIRNLRIGVQILLGLPFAEEKGTVEEIRTDFSPTQGRMLIRDADNTEIVRSYSFPKALSLETNPATGSLYVVGDTVEQFAPLVEGAGIIDWLTDPKWFQGLLHQGIFYEVEKFHKFVVRVDEAAFSLSSLLFVKNFILKIKPTYTYPLFVVRRQIKDTEVSTSDSIVYSGKLLLNDSPCEDLVGNSYMFDQPNPAGGGWKNQFDADPNPPPPTFPVADGVHWGYDKGGLVCPDDQVTRLTCETFGAPATPTYDTVFAFDTPVGEVFHFDVSGPVVVPAPPGTFPVTPSGANTASFTGTMTKIRLITLGGPGTDPTDYQVVVYLNAVEVSSQNFLTVLNGEYVFTISLPITAADVVTVAIRCASGTSSRSPAWTRVLASVSAQSAAVWTFDGTVAAGSYCVESAL